MMGAPEVCYNCGYSPGPYIGPRPVPVEDRVWQCISCGKLNTRNNPKPKLRLVENNSPTTLD